jgi:hypothetical protein
LNGIVCVTAKKYSSTLSVVTEADVIEKLPSLLEEVKSRAVIISDGDNDLGVLISMEDFQFVRRAKADRFLSAMHDFGKELRDAAAEEGVSVDELEKMLDRKAPQSRD